MSKRREARMAQLRDWIAVLEKQNRRAREMVRELDADIEASRQELEDVMMRRKAPD